MLSYIDQIVEISSEPYVQVTNWLKEGTIYHLWYLIQFYVVKTNICKDDGILYLHGYMLSLVQRNLLIGQIWHKKFINHSEGYSCRAWKG